ncbi:MAG: hypothetical protein LBM98_10230 [Oscillospiraceae bacterium]|nr:hypothetical protein [Oscillospiraceae bacterium]
MDVGTGLGLLRAARNDGAGLCPPRRTAPDVGHRTQDAGRRTQPACAPPPKPPSLEGGSARRRGGCPPQDATPSKPFVSDI